MRPLQKVSSTVHSIEQLGNIYPPGKESLLVATKCDFFGLQSKEG